MHIPSVTVVARDILIPLVPTSLLVMFLFYIDEGWYSFRWMSDWGNWIVFAIYLIIFLPVFWLLSLVLFRQQAGLGKALLMSLIGIPLVLGFLYVFVV